MTARGVRLVLVLAVGAATAGIAVSASPAAAACAQAPAPGVPIPDGAPRDPLLDRLDLDRSWLFTRGDGVTVGVVDTGVDATHPKLSGVVDAGSTVTAQLAPADATLTPGGGEDCHGHGTAVAGIVAGSERADDDRVAGIAPGARLWPVRLDGEIGKLPPQAIAQGIVDAADHATVINLSFARPADDPAIRAAVEYAVSRDVLVVAAAGNESSAEGGSGQTWYPAAYDGVFAVAAVDAEGAPLDESNAGSWVDIAAPGEDLMVPALGGGYLSVTGTSFAAAVVSGVAALVRARFPSLTAAEVGARITRTAVPPGSGTADERVGSGVVDPYAALTYSPAGLAAAGPAAGPGSVRLGETVSGPAPDDPRLATALRWAGVLLLAAVAALVTGVVRRQR